MVKPWQFSSVGMSSCVWFLMWWASVDSSVISSMNSVTSCFSPSMTSSTEPSGRFLTHPMTSNPRAIWRVA